MNKEEFRKSVLELGIAIDDAVLEKLDLYAQFLIEYNETTNLTAITDYESIYLKHFYDSLTIVKAIDLSSCKTLVDVGTGAGFPGVVLKIFFANLEVILIDSNNKKIKFLNELIARLNLSGITAINTRSEDYAKTNLEKYDLVTARAVTNLAILTELCLPLVKVGGYFIPLKGSASEEIDEATNIIKTLNGKIEDVYNFTLPIENATRTIIKIKKMSPTPEGYPRNYDKIKKSLKKNRK